MPDVILTGFDGSPASRAAVTLARTLARPSGARVVAATGYEVPTPVYVPIAPLLVTGAELDEGARHGAALTLAELQVDGVERELHPGGPAAALCVLAEREEADLIVVGATHRSGLGRILPGSVAEQLIGGAPCAIAVAPQEHEVDVIRSVAVAYDGRRESVAALEHARDLALAHGATLRVLAVCLTPPPTPGEPVVSGYREKLERRVADVVAALPQELQATGEVLGGTPADALQLACRDGVDLLVTGSRGYGPLRGAFVGSVARELVDHAPCPVLVVPRRG